MKKKLYNFVKNIYWNMPSFVQKRLNGLRYQLVRILKIKLADSKKAGVGEIDSNQFESIIKNTSNVFIFELSVDWNIDLYQRPQHLATALGKIPNTIIIYKTLGDSVSGFLPVDDSVWLTDDFPFVDSIACATRIYFSTSVFNELSHMREMSNKGLVVYDYIDHISEEISGTENETQHLTRIRDYAFSGGASINITTATKLFEEAKRLFASDNVYLIPNGVDIDHYSKSFSGKVETSNQTHQFKQRYSKLVGYFGAVAPWLDYDLVNQVVEMNPDVGFIFIGPDYGGCRNKLPKNTNFKWLGPIQYEDLPLHAINFDLCWIPFKSGDIAKTTSPLKLFEYFALGKPVVVVSDMYECVQYDEVLHGEDPYTVSRAIRLGLKYSESKDYANRIKELSVDNSWDKRASDLFEIVEGVNQCK